MITATSIAYAISESAASGEIVHCTVTSLTSGLRAVSEAADVDDYAELDDASSDARYVDVWGETYDGVPFRLHLYAR